MSLLAFFEIPAVDFGRAVKFYQKVFEIEMHIMDCENEKMAFFQNEGGEGCAGAVSWSADFNFVPSNNGVLISLRCKDMEKTLSVIEQNGGKMSVPKTKIEADEHGYFSIFTDCEGNRIGLYSVN